jgi:hypothetical protein
MGTKVNERSESHKLVGGAMVRVDVAFVRCGAAKIGKRELGSRRMRRGQRQKAKLSSPAPPPDTTHHATQNQQPHPLTPDPTITSTRNTTHTTHHVLRKNLPRTQKRSAV